MPDVIAVNIVNFDFPATRDFHSCFHLREDTEKEIILTNALEIHYLNMIKYRKQGKNVPGGFDSGDPLSRWLAWFDKGSPSKLIAEVLKMDTEIQSANERMVYVAGNKELVRAYWRYQMELSDRTSELSFARDEGHAEGLKEGLEKSEQKASEKELEKAKEIARNLRAEGISTDIIIKATGLSQEEIKQI